MKQSVLLPYRRPYDWDGMLGFLAARAVDGVEHVADGRYVRRVAGGTVEVAHHPERSGLAVTTDVPDGLARVARVFDVDGDVEEGNAHLACDPWLAPLVVARPGLRVPGGWDGFELAVRAVLGQQVTVSAARLLAGRLVRLCGRPCFPSPSELLSADLASLGMPGARRAALVAVAEAAASDPGLFEVQGPLEDVAARLRALRGVGEWTAQYIALRALRHPDAFPAGDVGLLRGASLASGRPVTPAALRARAERWRPHRARAAQHLWAADGDRHQ